MLRLRKESFGRSRWAAFGAAVAVSLGAGGIGWIAHAANTAPSTFVGITPCRLFDTRPAPDNVGDRNTPLAAGEELTRQVTGTNGNCNIPANATAIAYNLTVPTSISGYLTIFPADATRPTSSNINPVAGESVKANGGIVGLSSTGAIKVYTLTGPVNAILDITGYFTAAGGGTGVIPSGQTVTGEVVYDTHRSEQVSSSDRVGVDLPGVAPAPLTNATVNFASGGGDNDATCTGTLSEPTAPPGKVCIYLSASSGIGFMNGTVGNLPTRSFRINMDYAAGGGETDLFLIATWAYTAP